MDNTNIMYWEFLPYLKIAHRFNFVTLLVEPKTPWRYDAQELFARNIHNVGLDVIESRVKKLQEKHVFPAYYGWMLSAEDSAHLKRLAVKLAIAVLQVEELRFLIEGNQDILMNQFIRTPNEDMVEWKERCDLYHCTAFYTGYGRRPGKWNNRQNKSEPTQNGRVSLLRASSLFHEIVRSVWYILGAMRESLACGGM